MFSKANQVRKHVVEEKQKPLVLTRIYPFQFQKRRGSSSSSLSISLSLSHNSNDSSLTDSTTFSLDRNTALALRPSFETSDFSTTKSVPIKQQLGGHDCRYGELRRCSWITNYSDKMYVSFHDEVWGVPAYNDNELFELLSFCGMLMDYNWTEILKRRQLLRETFGGFDPEIVAKMEENEITPIMLAESRVRCIINNARCIVKVAKVYGSFGGYLWGKYVNYKPNINKFKHPRKIPLRTPKAEAISKDLIRLEFRLVGPVIVYSFMQAAGLTNDHLIHCFRHAECVNLAERPWRHI